MTNPPQPNFDHIARIYRWAEYVTLGPLLQRARMHFLPQLPHCRRAVVLGDGDGRFLAALLRQQPELHALAVDTSSAMLHLLSKRCSQSASLVQTLHASALNIVLPTETDLVATHFFLDCLTQHEVDSLASILANHMRPGTLWLLSDFGQPVLRALRPLASIYISALYLAFRILTGLRVNRLPNPQSSLSNAGFDCIGRRDIFFGLIYTEMWRRR